MTWSDADHASPYRSVIGRLSADGRAEIRDERRRLSREGLDYHACSDTTHLLLMADTAQRDGHGLHAAELRSAALTTAAYHDVACRATRAAAAVLSVAKKPRRKKRG